MDHSELENYIKQVIEYIMEDALEAKKDYLKENTDFKDGLLMGYYYVLTLLKQQAQAFGVDEENLNLKDMDPDRDLLNKNTDK